MRPAPTSPQLWTSRVLCLACRDSRPSNTDSYVSRFKETTPYAIVNMSATVKEMREYINRHVFQCMEYWLDGRDDWIQETYRFARQYMKTAVSQAGTLSNYLLLTKCSRQKREIFWLTFSAYGSRCGGQQPQSILGEMTLSIWNQKPSIGLILYLERFHCRQS